MVKLRGKWRIFLWVGVALFCVSAALIAYGAFGRTTEKLPYMFQLYLWPGRVHLNADGEQKHYTRSGRLWRVENHKSFKELHLVVLHGPNKWIKPDGSLLVDGEYDLGLPIAGVFDLGGKLIRYENGNPASATNWDGTPFTGEHEVSFQTMKDGFPTVLELQLRFKAGKFIGLGGDPS